jgi:hypothetical protein
MSTALPAVSTVDRRGHACRRALTIIEVTLAFAILAIMLAASLRMVRVVTDQQRIGQRRELALQAAQAVSEQIGNIPWEQLTPAAVNQVAIPASLAEQLPNATLSTSIADENDPTSRRVLVEIRWQSDDSRPSSVRLTSWVFPE